MSKNMRVTIYLFIYLFRCINLIKNQIYGTTLYMLQLLISMTTFAVIFKDLIDDRCEQTVMMIIRILP